MSELTYEQRYRLESEVLPAVISDPEYAAATIVRIEAENARLTAQRDALLEALDEIKNADGWHAHEVVYRVRGIADRAIAKVRGGKHD